MDFGEAMAEGSKPLTTAFSVTVDGAARIPSAVSLVGRSLVLHFLSNPATAGQKVTVTYTQPTENPDAGFEPAFMKHGPMRGSRPQPKAAYTDEARDPRSAVQPSNLDTPHRGSADLEGPAQMPRQRANQSSATSATAKRAPAARPSSSPNSKPKASSHERTHHETQQQDCIGRRHPLCSVGRMCNQNVNRTVFPRP